MAKITFKTKAKTVYNPDKTVSHQVAMVPVFTRAHCDMNEFRQHPKFGDLANSDLFPNLLSRVRRDMFKGKDYVRLDNVPDGVSIDASGFLLTVSVDV